MILNPKVKNPFRRPCKDCDDLYYPTGKWCRFCDDCLKLKKRYNWRKKGEIKL